jgi:HPt (histidine-containing phosphotransfer) domain-containing protein
VCGFDGVCGFRATHGDVSGQFDWQLSCSQSWPGETMDAPNDNSARVRADLAFWRDLAGGDNECARDLLTLYLADTSAQITLMVSGLAAGRPADVGRAAHTCAGSSSTCGIDRLAELFRRLEEQVRGNRIDELSDTLPLVVEAFDQVHRHLTEVIAASSAGIEERA